MDDPFSLATVPKGNHRSPIPFVGLVPFVVDDGLWPPPPAGALS
jgi:hypothetical protein